MKSRPELVKCRFSELHEFERKPGALLVESVERRCGAFEWHSAPLGTFSRVSASPLRARQSSALGGAQQAHVVPCQRVGESAQDSALLRP